MSFVRDLIDGGWLKTKEVISAFENIKRADFLPPEMKDLSELNEALPIGWGQTISQPLVVAFMLELLEPKKGEKILDIGSGSGWTTALLAYIVSGGEKIDLLKRGRVIGIERIKELKEFGEKNVSKYNFIEKGIVSFICADGSKGYKEEAPYDKILVSATSKKLYPSWQEQLKEGGRIVLPMGNSIWLFVKKKKGDGFEFEGQEYPGFVFVPLIES